MANPKSDNSLEQLLQKKGKLEQQITQAEAINKGRELAAAPFPEQVKQKLLSDHRIEMNAVWKDQKGTHITVCSHSQFEKLKELFKGKILDLDVREVTSSHTEQGQPYYDDKSTGWDDSRGGYVYPEPRVVQDKETYYEIVASEKNVAEVLKIKLGKEAARS